MNGLLVDMIHYMSRHHIIGAKHIPESVLFKSRLKHLSKQSQNEFYDDYGLLLKQNYFIRLKKRTGKGSDWHISLNPEMTIEITNLIEEQNEI